MTNDDREKMTIFIMGGATAFAFSGLPVAAAVALVLALLAWKSRS